MDVEFYKCIVTPDASYQKGSLRVVSFVNKLIKVYNIGILKITGLFSEYIFIGLYLVHSTKNMIYGI